MSLPAKDCTQCMWAEPVARGTAPKYECHLNPPTVLYSSDRNVPFFAYPEVGRNDWCSQHLDIKTLQTPVEQDAGLRGDTNDR